MIDWSATSKEDMKTISKMADRRLKDESCQIMTNKMDLTMDIQATHISSPLKLNELLEAKNGDFFHDIIGIMEHINRNTGKLTDCFSPRYSI